MVYKHRMKNGKIRHYSNKQAYLNSVRGMFANQYQKKNHTNKIQKAKNKTKKRLRHRGTGRVSSGKAFCAMCRGKKLSLDVKGVCKDCIKITEEYRQEKRPFSRSDKELEVILSDYLREYELDDISEVHESNHSFSLIDEENLPSSLVIPKVTVKLNDGETTEYLILPKNNLDDYVSQIWKSRFIEYINQEADNNIHNIIRANEFKAVDSQTMGDDIYSAEFDYTKENLEEFGLPKNASNDEIMKSVHSRSDLLYDDLQAILYLPYINFDRLYEIRKEDQNAKYGHFHTEQSLLEVTLYDSPNEKDYLGIMPD
ncbi:MAG: hypothetical protein ACW990_00300 [Promethearchaeota archaeon]|jgi:hypothetical protein